MSVLTKCETYIFELFERIERETRASTKLQLLKSAYQTCPTIFKKLVRYVYNDQIVFNVGSKTLKQIRCGDTYTADWSEFEDLLAKLMNVRSRSQQIQLLQQFFSKTDKLHCKWYKRMILKDLRIGIDRSLLSQVLSEAEYEHLLEIRYAKLKPMLAKSYTSLSRAKIEKLFHQAKPSDWYFEPKIDGLRLIAVIAPDGSFVCYTRNLMRIPLAEQLLADDIKRIYEKHSRYIKQFKNGIALDGELFSKNWNVTMSLSPNAQTISESAAKSLNWFVFDLIENPDSKTKEYQIAYIERKRKLNRLLANLKLKHIKYLPAVKVPKSAEGKIDGYLIEAAQKLIEKGFEGAVAKKADSPYLAGKRSDYWVKFKRFYTLDLLCVDIVPSDKNPDELGAIVVLYKGKHVKVGSGFTKEQRRYYLQHPEEIVGRIVEVKYMEETPDGSLRHPVFVRVRYDKTKPDA